MRIKKNLGILSVSVGLILSSPLTFAEEYKILFNKTEKPFIVAAATEPTTPPANPQGWVDFFNTTCGMSFADEDAMINERAGIACQSKNLTTLPEPGLSILGGSLSMHSNYSLVNVDGLSGLISTRDALLLYNNGLTNISGLSSLVSVGNNFSLEGNQLTNVDSLSNLNYVGYELNIQRNPDLTNVNGLQNLTTVLGPLKLYQNPNLTDISGLSKVTVGGIIYLEYLNYNVKIPSNSPICNGNPKVWGLNGNSWVNPMPKEMYCDL